MTDNSNIDEVIAFLDGFVDSFNFKRPGIEQSLGRDIQYKVADRIQTRALSDRKGTGEPWKENSTRAFPWFPNGYKAWKLENYGADEPNSRTGQMLSQKSIRGRSTIEEREITMIYGTGEPPASATFGSPAPELLERDRKVTDVQKAYFAHTGQTKQLIKRPFYEVDESDGVAVSQLCQENLNDLIRETNALNGY
jgi:hypothetical protein